ncbi:hypothetical protein GDO81_012299 [Engystomops pustulosus]|uniref:Uncharacterized protein n=1 Tax=Engystomops pustulosus TaxID=76066 RepID=A0AAV7BKK1_ENGPU|nr:hypothetical protein GDO81_012299 [Engystomops pustulosus]
MQQCGSHFECKTGIFFCSPLFMRYRCDRYQLEPGGWGAPFQKKRGEKNARIDWAAFLLHRWQHTQGQCCALHPPFSLQLIFPTCGICQGSLNRRPLNYRS